MEKSDEEIVGEIRATEHEGYEDKEWASDMWWLVRRLKNPALRSHYLTHVAKAYDLCECPFCGGEGGWSGITDCGGDWDAECHPCGGWGFGSKAEIEAWEQAEEKARLEEEAKWEELRAYEEEREREYRAYLEERF